MVEIVDRGTGVHNIAYLTGDYRLVVVGELVCLNNPESYTVGGVPRAGLTLADRGQTKW